MSAEQVTQVKETLDEPVDIQVDLMQQEEEANTMPLKDGELDGEKDGESDGNEEDIKSSDNKDKKNLLEIKERFLKIIKDLMNDLLITYPELESNLDSNLRNVMEADEPSAESIDRVYDHCMLVFPTKFFDILYQNDDIFKTDDRVELLPGIDFKVLWNEDISDPTRETIWKYLQLILFTIVANMNNSKSFGETADLFEAIDEDAFKEKLQETIADMESCFDKGMDDNIGTDHDKNTENFANKNPMGGLPNPEELHEHMSSMLDGKLGSLAKEIADEAAHDLNIDLNSASSAGDTFKKLFKNPTKLLGLIKKVGGKLDDKIKSGEIKESELLEEASNMIKKMKSMPGMGNIQNMFKNMPGMDPNGKIDHKAMQANLERSLRGARQRDRMREKLAKKRNEKTSQNTAPEKDVSAKNTSIFSTGEPCERTVRTAPIPKEAAKKRRRRKKKK